MRTRKLATVVAAVAIASLAFAPAAFAAPVAWQSIDVTVHDEGSSSVTMITGTLPEGTPLPAQVELSVPAGGELQWAGEILGGDPSADPSATPQVRTVDGFDVYTFTLTKALIGQIEITKPAFYRFDGTGYSGSLNWVSTNDVDRLRLSVRLPAGSRVATMTPGAELLQGPEGSSYVDKSFDGVKAGGESVLMLSYVAASAAGTTAPPASDSTTPVIIVLLIAAAGGVLMIFAINRKMKGRNTDYVDEESEDDSPSAPAKSAAPAQAARASKSSKSVPEPAPAPKRANPALIITGAVIVVAVVAGVLAGQSSSSVTKIPDGFTQEFSQGDPCEKATFTLLKTPSESDAEKLFEAAKTANPLSAIAYTEGAPRVEVNFCGSSTSSKAVQDALATTGLIGDMIQPEQPGLAP